MHSRYCWIRNGIHRTTCQYFGEYCESAVIETNHQKTRGVLSRVKGIQGLANRRTSKFLEIGKDEGSRFFFIWLLYFARVLRMQYTNGEFNKFVPSQSEGT